MERSRLWQLHDPLYSLPTYPLQPLQPSLKHITLFLCVTIPELSPFLSLTHSVPVLLFLEKITSTLIVLLRGLRARTRDVSLA